MQTSAQQDAVDHPSVPGGARPTVSVVVPAHDEAGTIGDTLRALRGASTREVVQVVVVANGCSDRTAEVARAHGVEVVEIATASKVAALRAGDLATDVFPRVYLDADIRLTPGTLDELAAVLRCGEPVVSSPRVRFDTSRSSAGVRAFYRAFQRIPYVTDGLVGLGVYGLSEAGRSRFEVFPDVRGDDLFVQRLFADSERRTSGGEFVVSAPRDLKNLVRVRTRIAQGNAELSDVGTAGGQVDGQFERSTRSTGRALLQSLTGPRNVADVAVYVAVTALSRLLARRGGPSWHRDVSTR